MPDVPIKILRRLICSETRALLQKAPRVQATINLRRDYNLAELVNLVEKEGITIKKTEYATLIKQCGKEKALKQGKIIHEHISRYGYNHDRFLSNMLTEMYGKCGSPLDALKVFEKIEQKNVFSWTMMMLAYIENGHGREALDLFHQMESKGMAADKVSLIAAVGACACLKSLLDGKEIHSRIVDAGHHRDVIVGTALLNMYVKCRSLKDARLVFNKMLERNVFSWTILITAYAEHGFHREALYLFRQMQLQRVKADEVTLSIIVGVCSGSEDLAEGKMIHACGFFNGPELGIVVANALISMYGRCESIQYAEKMFAEMEERDIISWNAMIAAYSQNGQLDEALQLFDRMQIQLMRPNYVTFITLLDACASLAAVEEGIAVHEHVEKYGLVADPIVRNSLVNFYGKCGCLLIARKLFDSMNDRNVISWTAMIAAYAQYGCGSDALELLQPMLLEGVRPNKITFVSLLYACSHAGLLDHGHHSFVSLGIDHSFSLSAEHYGCIIDLLGRAGWLDESVDFVTNMALQPNAIIWTDLLASCKIHQDVDRGPIVAEHVYYLDPGNAAPYILLSGIYAAAGRWDDVRKVRKAMLIGKMRRQPCWVGIRFMGESYGSNPAYVAEEEISYLTGDDV